jgi:hypothetical protein
MWEMVFVEWEDCNILDKIKEMLTCPPTLIKKSTFGGFSNLKENQLEFWYFR